jgi:antirestriction protein
MLSCAFDALFGAGWAETDLPAALVVAVVHGQYCKGESDTVSYQGPGVPETAATMTLPSPTPAFVEACWKLAGDAGGLG